MGNCMSVEAVVCVLQTYAIATAADHILACHPACTHLLPFCIYYVHKVYQAVLQGFKTIQPSSLTKLEPGSLGTRLAQPMQESNGVLKAAMTYQGFACAWPCAVCWTYRSHAHTSSLLTCS